MKLLQNAILILTLAGCLSPGTSPSSAAEIGSAQFATEPAGDLGAIEIESGNTSILLSVENVTDGVTLSISLSDHGHSTFISAIVLECNEGVVSWDFSSFTQGPAEGKVGLFLSNGKYLVAMAIFSPNATEVSLQTDSPGVRVTRLPSNGVAAIAALHVDDSLSVPPNYREYSTGFTRDSTRSFADGRAGAVHLQTSAHLDGPTLFFASITSAPLPGAGVISVVFNDHGREIGGKSAFLGPLRIVNDHVLSTGSGPTGLDLEVDSVEILRAIRIDVVTLSFDSDALGFSVEPSGPDGPFV